MEQTGTFSLRELERMATLLRVLCADMVERAGSGHPGMPMGMSDVATVLFANHLRQAPSQPYWASRDRFVLSAGHGSALVYALLHLTGSQQVTLDQLKQLRRIGSLTPGHPEYGHTPGIECTTGPLGQGFATAVGMAIAQKMQQARLDGPHLNYSIYALAGDGCLMEGISHEAASLAGHHKLDNLIVLYDDNSITIDGSTAVSCSENTIERFEAYGWDACSIDGHDHKAIDAALCEARSVDRPCLIACRTKIGRGAPTKSGTSNIHGSILGPEEIEKMRCSLDWPHEPFDLPERELKNWNEIGRQGETKLNEWLVSVSNASPDDRLYINEQDSAVPPQIPAATLIKARKAVLKMPTQATRVSSQKILHILNEACPWLIGGSADLSGSTGAHCSNHTDVSSANFSGNFIRYGVREHAMAAAMNGIALSGHFRPYGSTFLVFSDYCRPAIRLSALMDLPVIYVMTHDSIGLGEDGPTHQPIEHIACLQLIPNLRVFRPCDAVETLEAWELALGHQGPSVIILSRQKLPALRQRADKNLTRLGAYLLAGDATDRQVTLIASGSEVSLAMDVRTALQKDGISAAVISAPCLALFEAQDTKIKNNLLAADTSLCIALEAGRTHLWRASLPTDALIFGVDEFGASGAAKELYEKFGLTTQHVKASIENALHRNKDETHEIFC